MKMFRGAAAAAAIAGSMLSVNAHAVNLSGDGIGEVAIAPYYTVRDGWSTLINLTNTLDVPVVVKVRFHEALNSRDVLDFNVALSAFDVFTGIVQARADGRPEFVTRDTANAAGRTTCTIPSSVGNNIPNIAGGEGTAMLVGGYQGNAGDDDTGPLGIDRLQEGYVEFVVMGYANGDKNGSLDADGSYVDETGNITAPTGITGETIEVIDVGNAIEQHECGLLDIAFNDADNNRSEPIGGGATQTNPYILDTARQFGEPISALKFNFRLLNPARGTEAGNSATTWSNFYNPGDDVGAPNANVVDTDVTNLLIGGVAYEGPDGVNGTFDDTVVPPEYNYQCTIVRSDERRSSADATPSLNDRAVALDWIPNDEGTAPADGLADRSCLNLITTQREYGFLEPSLNDAWPVLATFADDQLTYNGGGPIQVFTPLYTTNAVAAGFGGIDGKLRGIDAMSATIMRQAVVNEWSNNAAQGVTTDWVVTQPTKGFSVDRGIIGTGTTNGLQAAIVSERSPEADLGTMDLVDTTPGAGVFPADVGATLTNPLDGIPDAAYPPYENPFWESTSGAQDGKACSTVSFTYLDRAEQQPQVVGGGVIVSPAPPTTIDTDDMCYEANVLTFNGQTALGTAPNRVNIDTSGLATATNGWAFVTLDGYDDAVLPADVPNSFLPVIADDAGTAAVQSNGLRGLPVIGFNLKVRNFGTADANYASTLDHGYFRAYQNDAATTHPLLP